jgi:hypothetical protein
MKKNYEAKFSLNEFFEVYIAAEEILKNKSQNTM